MTHDDVIAEMLLAWEEARERGEPVAEEELCGDRPELLDALRASIRLLGRAGWMQPLALTAPGPPRTLTGRYALEQLIGSGGYAQVWRAYDLQLHRHVAVKVPRSSRMLTASQVEDVLTEARQIARLRHVNIITVHDVVKEGAGFFIVTDLVDGETLAARLRRGPMPPAEAAKLLAEVARVIDYAHGQGVVHRDLKPANVFLDKAGRPHVGDFGLARPTRELLGGSDQRGTLAYSSPEQLDGQPLDGRSDLWSLGVILYETLAGRPPFADDSPVRLRQAILAANVPEAPRVPAALMAVCRRCMAKTPAGRFGRGDDVAAALERAVRGRPAWRTVFGATLAVLAVGAVVGGTLSIPTAQPGPDVARRPEVEGQGGTAVAADPEPHNGLTQAQKTPQPRPPVKVLEGHATAIRAVRFRPDGGWVASADEQTLRLWPPAGEALSVNLPSPPTAMAFGPTGVTLLTGHEDGVVRQWWVGPRTADEQAESWASRAAMPGWGQVALLPFVPSQSAPFLTRSWAGDGTPVQAVASSPTGKLAAWTSGKRLVVWDASSNKAVAVQNKPQAATVALLFMPGEQLLAGYASGPDLKADLSAWQVVPFEDGLGLSPRGLMQNFGLMTGVRHVTAAPGFTFIVATLDGGLAGFAKAGDGPGFHLVAQLGQRLPGPRRTAVLPDARRTVSYGEGRTLCVWEPKSQSQRVVSDAHPLPVTDVAVNADGTLAVTGCEDGKVRIWRLAVYE